MRTQYEYEGAIEKIQGLGEQDINELRSYITPPGRRLRVFGSSVARGPLSFGFVRVSLSLRGNGSINLCNDAF